MNNSLHIITKPPSEMTDVLSQALCEGDGVIFIQDGVYWLTPAQTSIEALCTHKQIEFFALDSDIKARGLCYQSDDLDVVSYKGFVEIVAKFEKTITW